MKKDNKKIDEEEYKLFGSRRETDNLTASLLVENKVFLSDLEKIRAGFLIPSHLKSCTDTYIGYLASEKCCNDDMFGGVYVNELLDEEKRNRFKKAIMDILEKYELGMNFFTWVQWLILYRETPTGSVGLDFNFFKRLKDSLVELFRLPKNTQEKRVILEHYRGIFHLPNTGRIPKEHTKDYKYFISVLNRKKPKVRKPRVNHSVDFAVLDQHKKTVSIDGKNIKNTYEVLVASLTEESSAEEDYRKIKTLRKRKERLIKQINKVKN